MGEFSEMQGLPSVMNEIMDRLPGGTFISNKQVVRNVNTVFRQEGTIKPKINMETTEKKNEIVLPTSPRKAERKVPRHIIISGKPKSGKTTAVSKLKNCLIIDLENGTEFVDGIIMAPPEGVGPVSTFKWLRELAKKIKDAGKPYDYVVIDTLSQIDMLSEWEGTWVYMNTIIGKSFNRQVDDSGKLIYDANSKSIMLKPDDINYQSVITLPQGSGYYYSRNAVLDMFELLKDLGKICTIFICHITDKMIAEKNGEQVMIKDLALTGKLQGILPRLVDSICTLWNEDGQIMISFKGNEDKIGGMRGLDHLQNYSGPLDWDQVFLTEATIK